MFIAQRYPVERVTSAIVTVWGICLTLTVACKNYQSLYAQRFFLGVLESGISPLFMLIVVSRHIHNVLRWSILLTSYAGKLVQKG